MDIQLLFCNFFFLFVTSALLFSCFFFLFHFYIINYLLDFTLSIFYLYLSVVSLVAQITIHILNFSKSTQVLSSLTGTVIHYTTDRSLCSVNLLPILFYLYFRLDNFYWSVFKLTISFFISVFQISSFCELFILSILYIYKISLCFLYPFMFLLKCLNFIC